MKKIIITCLCMSPALLPAQNYIDRYLTDPLTYTVIGSSTDQVNAPRDLDVKPNTSEIWVGNYGTSGGGSFIIFYNAGLPTQTSQYRKDTHADHFDRYTSAFAFSEIGEFGTIGENQNPSSGSTFMGPSLWSSDTAIFARVFQNNWVNGLPLGSHLDMLHQSPYGMGIAHDSAKAYWVFDGYNGNICKYDFVMGHGPGYEDHSAGKIWRYTDVAVTRVNNVPSHMCKDTATSWLYFVDGGPKQVKRLNTVTGNVAGNLTPPSSANESLAGYYDVQGATVEIIDSFTTQPCGLEVYNGRLLVGDYTNGNIYVYDITGPNPVFMDTIVTGQAGMMGIKIGPDGKIWFVNRTANTLVRIDASLATDDAAIQEITSPSITNFDNGDPDFYSLNHTVCSASVTPSVQLYNAGSNVLTSAVITYVMDNGTPVNYNWSGSLAAGSSLMVSLPAGTLTDGLHRIYATVASPNGNTDINPANNAKAGSFRTMAMIGTVPYSEGFTSPVSEPAGWSHEGYNPNNTMEWNSAGGLNLSVGSIKMDNFSGSENIGGQVDYLRMPAIDMSGAPAGTSLQFNVAYAKYDASSNDRLEVRISTDCGATWSTIYNKSGSTLSTAPITTTPFTPGASQWRQETVSLSTYIGQPEVRLMFVTTSDWGNNLFLDDINVLNTTGMPENPVDVAISVFPNPNDGNVFVETSDKTNTVNIFVYNILGELVLTQTANQPEERIHVDLSMQPAGEYMIRVQQNNAEKTERISVVK